MAHTEKQILFESNQTRLMLYHHLRLAFRQWLRHRRFSAINMPGLSIGLASYIIIGLYASGELSFDPFHSDERLQHVLSIAAGLAIVMACTVLFGLNMDTARQRTREIGIRKIPGTSVSQVPLLLSQNSIKLVFVAILVT